MRRGRAGKREEELSPDDSPEEEHSTDYSLEDKALELRALHQVLMQQGLPGLRAASKAAAKARKAAAKARQRHGADVVRTTTAAATAAGIAVTGTGSGSGSAASAATAATTDASTGAVICMASECATEIPKMAGTEAGGPTAPPQTNVDGYCYRDVLMSVESLGLRKASRNFSHSAVTSLSSVAGADACAEAPVELTQGRWHILRVPGADHSLGTWASDKSDEMFRSLFELLDAQHARSRRQFPLQRPFIEQHASI